MLIEVTMPMLDEVMEEGTIVTWCKKPDDAIRKGETLLVIETDKATMDIEASHTGVVRQVLAQEGQTVPCNQIIATIEVSP